MVALDRKLDALTSALTARQRALVVVRAVTAGESVDDRLHRYCPPQDQQEFEAILKAVDRGNNTIYSTLLFVLEWLAQTELKTHWLSSLAGYQARERAIRAVERPRLPALPPAWDGRRTILRGSGREIEGSEPSPATWPEFSAWLRAEIEGDLKLRWEDYLNAEAALDGATAALGTDATAPELRECLDGLREGVLALQATASGLGCAVDLEAIHPTATNFASAAFNLDVLREVPAEKHARERLHAQQLAELEAWERERSERFDDD